MSIGSIFFIAMPRSLYLLLVARVLIGFGHGYAYLTCIVHASEIVTQKLRGIIVATLNFCILSSILMTGAVSMSLNQEQHGFGTMQSLGITGLVFAVMGFILIPFFTRESPVSLIRQKKYDQAVSLMIQLRCESTETWSIKNEYNELKAMVEEDEQSSNNIFDGNNMRPLMLITLLRVGSVLSFNFGLNMIRLRYTTTFTSDDGLNAAVIVLMGIRMTAGMVTLFTIDIKGRRPHFLVSYGGSSITLILMGAIVAFNDTSNLAWLITLLQILFELFGGLGIGVIADVYSSEAFNVIKKPNSILFTTMVEFILHAIIISTTFNIVSTTTYSWIFLVGSGTLIMIITVFLHKELPETAKMSIRQTRNEFLKSGEVVFGSGSKMSVQNITFN